MHNINEIAEIIKINGLKLSGDVVKNGIDDNNYLAFIETSRNENNHQSPSNAKIKSVSDLLNSDGINIDFVLINRHNENVEGGIRATLLYRFGDLIRNSFVSTTDKDAFLWLVPKKSISEKDINEIKKRVSVIFESAGLNLKQVHSTNAANLPSKLAILSTIRIISPASADRIKASIEIKGFVVPSMDWLARSLDSLRKNNMLVRKKDGSYTLSLGGLRACGTIKSARSPDITRLLDLGRRNA